MRLRSHLNDRDELAALIVLLLRTERLRRPERAGRRDFAGFHGQPHLCGPLVAGDNPKLVPEQVREQARMLRGRRACAGRSDDQLLAGGLRDVPDAGSAGGGAGLRVLSQGADHVHLEDVVTNGLAAGDLRDCMRR